MSERIEADGVGFVHFTCNQPIKVNEFFEELSIKFKLRLLEEIRERDAIDIQVYCTWGYDYLITPFHANKVIGGICNIAKYSISNTESIDICYSSVVNKLREKWNAVQVREETIQCLEIAFETLNGG